MGCVGLQNLLHIDTLFLSDEYPQSELLLSKQLSVIKAQVGFPFTKTLAPEK